MKPQAPEIFDQIKGLLSSVSHEQALQEIDRIEDEISKSQTEQAKWRTLAGLIQQLGSEDEHRENGHSASVPTMRQAVRRILEDQTPGTSMKLAHIGAAIIERGWMEDSTKDWHRLQMMASIMKKQEQLERPKTGYYRLPLKDSTPDGDDAERQGTLATPPGTGPG